MKKVFFSYTLRDIDKNFLNKLKMGTYNIGIQCYIDLLDNDYCTYGFQHKLLLELKLCDFICVIKTPRIKNSKWVMAEIREAIRLKMKILYIDYNDIKKNLENNKLIDLFKEII